MFALKKDITNKISETFPLVKYKVTERCGTIYIRVDFVSFP